MNFHKFILVGLSVILVILSGMLFSGDLIIEGTAYSGGLTRKGGPIDSKAFDFQISKHVPLLIDHRQDVHGIVGRVISTKMVGNQLKFVAIIPDIEKNKDVIDMVKTGILRNVSMGFISKESVGIIIRVDLMEISLVAVPADPGAIIEKVKELEE